jgi:hypothetical protein
LDSRIAETTGVSAEWLMDDDPTAPMISASGELFSRSDFERRKAPAPSVHESRAHYYFNEARLGIAFDVLCRLLGAGRNR